MSDRDVTTWAIGSLGSALEEGGFGNRPTIQTQALL